LTEFGQFDSEILYNDTAKIQNCTHNQQNAHITYLKIRQILTGEDGPLRLNLLIKQQIINISDKN